MTPIEDRLAATVRCGVIHSGDDQERLIAHKQAAEAVAEIRDLRKQNKLLAEGKIGTYDHIVEADQMVWQVTEERKNALRFSISGEMSPTCSCKYCKDAIATIRAMLQEAE
jgi:hypothetical protein